MISNKYNIGIEREGLRCNSEGDLSSKPHSVYFGNRNTNKFITTDFGAAQLEIRTPVCDNTKNCYEMLENITNVVLEVLRKDNEYLWPYSMPCKLPPIEKFKFGEYNENVKEHEYEMYLYKKYGLEMYCMSGIHLNFSIKPDYYEKLKKINKSLPDKLDDAYFKIIRNYLKRVWMLIYLFGATPKQLGDNSYQNECSIRNSYKQGFKNIKLDPISFETKAKHIESIRKNIADGNISKISELYTPIRIKTPNKYDIEELANEPVNHIEVRVLDVDPFDKCSISLKEMDFITAFLFYCLLTDENENDYSYDYRLVAENGISPEQRYIINSEIDKMLAVNKKYNLEFRDSILAVKKDLETGNILSNRVKELVKNKGFINAFISLAKDYDQEAYDSRYFVKYKGKKIEYANAALIKDAIAKGIEFNVIDYKGHNSIVEFIGDKRSDYVVSATQTKKDNFIVHYLSEDKYVAKRIMKQNHISVPEGTMINKKTSKKELKEIIDKYTNQPVVIKPRTTNGGVGVTVFSAPPTKEDLKLAIKYAYKFDNHVLIENYIKGTGYRFLVINNKISSVVIRRDPRVIGDGRSTILQLIKTKNKEDWHKALGTLIKIDKQLRNFIKMQHFSLKDIPKKNEIVYLRDNTCSTGGESINVTNIIPERFIKVAEKCAKLFGIHICGIDMIIDDLNSDNYAILDVNSDCVYDINEWPYEGEETHVGLKILNMLGLVDGDAI